MSLCNHSCCCNPAENILILAHSKFNNLCNSCSPKPFELTEGYYFENLLYSTVIGLEYPNPEIDWQRNDIAPLTNFPVLYLLLKYRLELLEQLEVRTSPACLCYNYLTKLFSYEGKVQFYCRIQQLHRILRL